MDQKEVCISCRKPQGQHHCGLCGESVCRACAMFLEQGTFAFKATLPPELEHSYYCAPCYEAQVEPELAAYGEILARAKEVFFFFNTRKKPVPTLKRSRDPIEVLDRTDRDETILHLGFLAASQGFNAVINADVACSQVRNHGWQKSSWHGKGFPAQVDAERLDRHSDDDY